MGNKSVVVRADGDAKTGLGHIYRAIALVDMLKDDFTCLFIKKDSGDQSSLVINNQIRSYCNLVLVEHSLSVEDEIEKMSFYIDKETIIILDGYAYDGNYQRQIRKFGKALVVIDDNANIHFYADLVINHGDPSVFGHLDTENYTKVLTGFDYSILRSEFTHIANKRRIITKIDTIFICMGGADPFNVTNKFLRAAKKIEFIKKIIVVTGNSFAFHGELALNIKSGTQQIVHEHNISAARMVELIKTSDISISTASTVALEICCVKSGLIAGKVAENQTAIYYQLLNRSCAMGIDDFINATETEICDAIHKLNDILLVQKMVNDQALVLDGRAGMRIVSEIKKLSA